MIRQQVILIIRRGVLPTPGHADVSLRDRYQNQVADLGITPSKSEMFVSIHLPIAYGFRTTLMQLSSFFLKIS